MSNSNIASIYEQIAKEQPTDSQIKDLSNIIDKLELQDSDSFIDILVCLEYYRKLYTEIPTKIDTATKNAVKRATETAQQDISQKISIIQTQLAKNLQETVIAASKASSVKSVIQWTIIGLIILTICFTGALYYMHTKAYESGKAQGFANAKEYNEFIERNKDNIFKYKDIIENQKMLSGAYFLYKNNDLESILECKYKGWVIKQQKKIKICYPNGYYKNEEWTNAGFLIP